MFISCDDVCQLFYLFLDGSILIINLTTLHDAHLDGERKMLFFSGQKSSQIGIIFCQDSSIKRFIHLGDPVYASTKQSQRQAYNHNFCYWVC